MQQPLLIDQDLYLIDGFDMNIRKRTSIYVLAKEKLTLIGIGPSPAVPHVQRGLQKLGFHMEEVEYVILTHAHLDHAGGIGLFMQSCPNAKIICHPDAVQYLLQPRKVAAVTRAMYGDNFTDFFDPIRKVYEEDIITKQDGDELDIGIDCTLRFIETPGHMPHHLVIYDKETKRLFTGNSAGIRYEQLAQVGVDFVLPFTPANQFDPEAMKKSLEKLKQLPIEQLCYGHFGVTNEPEKALHQVSNWLDIFIETGEQAFVRRATYDELMKQLQQKVAQHLLKKGIMANDDVYLLINLDLYLSSLGLIDYFQKIEQ